MANNEIGRYKSIYSKILSMYPRKFRQRFGEPMLQTFGDMCWERVESGEGLAFFTAKVSGETFIQIIKEHIKEVVMSTKNISARTYVSVAVILSIGAFLFLMLRDYRDVRIISPNSTIKEARELSKGKAEACLSDNESAKVAVQKNDISDNQFSAFGLTIASGIIDVPAGTYVEESINSYSGNIAKGSLKYDGDYGNYNYEVKYLGNVGEWELVSLIACNPE